MADQRPWQELPIPGTHVLARLLGRGRVLMDPGSQLAYRLFLEFERHWRRRFLDDLPKPVLQAMLRDLLKLCERISDELDNRDGL